MPQSWSFRFVPCGWLPWLAGTQTLRVRSVKLDAGSIDIVRESDTLIALMGDFEARSGPFVLSSNVSWTRMA